MEDSIFTKIIRGDIPSYKIYEDEDSLAFLDIHPVQPGHVLVVPKMQVDKLYDLPSEQYQNLMAAAQKVAARMDAVLDAPRIAWAVVGFDVSHAHIHLVPVNHGFTDLDPKNADPNPNPRALEAMVQKLKLQ